MRCNGQDPLTIKAFQYDITCNGFEIASGGIRNHRPEAMVKAFEIAGYGEKDVVERFGGMYRAFQYGAPPHGGMAAGVDRIVMLLCGTTNLREISLFPMNQQAVDLLMGAPSEVAPKQLRELHIRLNLPDKGKRSSDFTSALSRSLDPELRQRHQRIGLQQLDQLHRRHLAARRELERQRLPCGVSTKRTSASTSAAASGLVAAASRGAGLDAVDDGAPRVVAADVLACGHIARPRDRRRRGRAA